MINITETSTFEATIPEVEITDPVLGGIAGQSNQSAEKLTNRTRWLYDHVNSYDGIAPVSSAVTIDNTYLRKLIYIDASGNLSLAIAALSGFQIGQALHFKCKCPVNKAVTITPDGSETFTHGNSTKTVFWLCDGEQMTLVKRSSTVWEIINAIGNFNNVGNDGMVRKRPRNTVDAIGTDVLRVNFPRLWAEVESLAIDDATWLSDPLLYRTHFSTGDGVSTFRLPDMRSMFWRGLDLGRGVSIARIGGDVDGAFEPSGIEEHFHSTNLNPNANSAAGFGKITTGSDGPEGSLPLYKSGGAIDGTTPGNSLGRLETTVKNAGFIPVIYY